MTSANFQLAGPHHGHKFDHGLAGISWPFHPTVLGMLIPRPGKDFANRPLNVLLLD